MSRFFRASKIDIENCFEPVLPELMRTTKLNVSDRFIQHGNTSVLLHSLAVAFYSYKLWRKLHLPGKYRRELVRGALLHDYFLYDWHSCKRGKELHGFFHPSTALKNARRDTEVSPLEADIIKKHMFPLTPIPPLSRAGWMICLVDKVCSVYETFNKDVYNELRSYIRAGGFGT